MPVEAALLVFGGLGAAVLFLVLLNRYSGDNTGVLDDDGRLKDDYKKSDEPPQEWTGYEI